MATTKRLVACLMISVSSLMCATEETYKITQDAPYRSDQEKSRGFGAFAQLLYWKTHIATFPYALTAMAGGQNLSTDQKLQEVAFCRKPGFRVGATYMCECSDWNVSLVYTRFNQSASASIAKTDTLNLTTIWDITTIVNADTASACDTQRFQYVDFLLGNRLDFGCFFSIDYKAGLKWARLQEMSNILYVGSSNASPALTSDVTLPVMLNNLSNNVGIMAQARGVWYCDYGFGLYSRADLAVLRSNFTVSQSQTFNAPDFQAPQVFTLANTQCFKALKTNLAAEFGIEWHHSFYCDAIDLGLNFGYELNYWPTQLLLARFVPFGDPTSTTGTIILTQQSSDVGFNGFNFGFSISF